MTGALGAFVHVTPVQASRSVALNGSVRTPRTSSSTWTAIVPVRSLTQGKSRLTGKPQGSADLIEAFAIDVLRACSGCQQIERTVVVSPDPAVHELAHRQGCDVFIEPKASGINEAIAAARDAYASTSPVIAILGDAPCLSPEVLTAVLAQAADHDVSFVADAAGTGSTMWCSQITDAAPHFGSHSRAHHRASGAVELGPSPDAQSPHLPQDVLTWARARRDVDTEVDLWDALRLGAGTATTSAATTVVASPPRDSDEGHP